MLYKYVPIVDIAKDRSRNIYCFGAGRAFDVFMDEFMEYGLAERVKAVVDNYAGAIPVSSKVIQGVEFPIISLERMLADIDDEDFILITASAYQEIISQLEKIDRLKCIEYCIYLVMRFEFYDAKRQKITIPDCLFRYNEIKIPKVIHYCWFGGQEIPIQYRQWMQSWKKFCPDYEIIEWNEGNYDVRKCRYISEAYNLKKWAFVSDYARIDIINEYGGVYLDTDVELIKNIDPLLMNDAFCGFESSRYVNYGLGFGAHKLHHVLGEIIDYYNKSHFINDEGTFNKITCPVIQSEIMEKHGLIRNGQMQVVNGMTVFPEKVLCGMSPYTFRTERNTYHTYAIHHFAASWMGGEGKEWKDTLVSYIKRDNSECYFYPDA